jgi:flagellar motor component MotA
MRIFGFLIIAVSLFFTIMFAFFGLPSPSAAKGLIDIASLICVLGLVLGGCLIAYGSDTYKGCGATFKSTLSREEAEIAVSVHKLAVRISIGSSFIGVMFGVIAMLGAMGGSSGDSWDMGAFTHGIALALITTLYGLVFAFCLFLPLQYYFQHQLGKDS